MLNSVDGSTSTVLAVGIIALVGTGVVCGVVGCAVGVADAIVGNGLGVVVAVAGLSTEEDVAAVAVAVAGGKVAGGNSVELLHPVTVINVIRVVKPKNFN